MAKKGRPTAQIDKEEFEKLCEMQCTKEEICAWFDVTDKTIGAWCKRTYGCNFSVIFSQKRGRGKISLRRSQWRLAENNTNMAIFLGKNYLGQQDNPKQDTEREIIEKLDEMIRGFNDGIKQEADRVLREGEQEMEL